MRALYVLSLPVCIGIGFVGAQVVGVGAGIECPSQSLPVSAVATAIEPSREHVRDDVEVEGLRARNAELEARLKDLAARVESDKERALPAEETESSPERVERERKESLKWRVSAIEKFVPLTVEQRERLERKFDAEAQGVNAPEQIETLEEIIGEEGAAFYRQQVQAAFQRVQDEELSKEVVWLARQLNLSAEQERAIQQSFQAIEAELQSGTVRNGTGSAGSGHERVKAMIEENRKRNEQRAARVKELVSPEQYQAYMASQSESSAADVEVFHDPGAH
jgi:hypothetical protein